jgi:hypothetical protein
MGRRRPAEPDRSNRKKRTQGHREREASLFVQESNAAVQTVSRAGFVFPLHGGFCFSGLPGSIERLFGSGGSQYALPEVCFAGVPPRRRVVLFFLDAFGWAFIERHRSHPGVRLFFEHGRVSLLTSQFPSSTGAHVTTLKSGLSVGATGVPSLAYFDPLAGGVMNPFKYSLVGSKGQIEGLRQRGVDPHKVFPFETLYTRLGRAGVRSCCVFDQRLAVSSFSAVMNQGAQAVPFVGPHQIPDLLRLVLSEHSAGGATFVEVYVDQLDAIGHDFGPGSPEFAETARAVLDGFAAALEVVRELDATAIMVADHGQVDIDCTTTVSLTAEVPGILGLLRTAEHQGPLPAGGSMRDCCLYVRDEAVDQALQLLRSRLGDIGLIEATATLVARGVFGDPGRVRPDFIDRMGSIVVAPRRDATVWLNPQDKAAKRGSHGGLSEDEMRIPLMVL